MLVVGGLDAVWKYNNPAWDTMVYKIVLIGRSVDIPTISGEDYLIRLQMRNKDVHAIKNVHNQGVYLDMSNVIRNAAFAIMPYGTVRKQDYREQLEGLASHAALAIERARRMAEEAWAAAERPVGSSRDTRGAPPQSLVSAPKAPPGPPLVGALRPPPPPPPRVAATTLASVWDTVVDFVWTREAPLAKAGVPPLPPTPRHHSTLPSCRPCRNRRQQRHRRRKRGQSPRRQYLEYTWSTLMKTHRRRRADSDQRQDSQR